jgi:hypothetical protein
MVQVTAASACCIEFKNGETPDAIQSHFPTLSLDQTYGAIVSYLGNKDGGGSVREPDRFPEALPPRRASYVKST